MNSVCKQPAIILYYQHQQLRTFTSGSLTVFCSPSESEESIVCWRTRLFRRPDLPFAVALVPVVTLLSSSLPPAVCCASSASSPRRSSMDLSPFAAPATQQNCYSYRRAHHANDTDYKIIITHPESLQPQSLLERMLVERFWHLCISGANQRYAKQRIG